MTPYGHFFPRRHSPRWRFWRERFSLGATYDLPIPPYIADMVRGPVERGFLRIWQDDSSGQWYLRGLIWYRWDGATMVPTPECTVRATFAHDIVYEHVGAIADAWDCSRRDARRFGDELFRYVLRTDGSRWKRLYYRGVRALGGAWNELGRLLKGEP